MSFTLRNIKEDLEDIGHRFDGPPDLEFRAGTTAARARAIRSQLPARPAPLSLSVRPHAYEARGGLRRPERERADESRRRDRRAQAMGRSARPAGACEATSPGPKASRSSSSARPISARIPAETSMASATGGLISRCAIRRRRRRSRSRSGTAMPHPKLCRTHAARRNRCRSSADGLRRMSPAMWCGRGGCRPSGE